MGTPHLDVPDAHAAVHPRGAELRAVGFPPRQHGDLAGGHKEAAGGSAWTTPNPPRDPPGITGAHPGDDSLGSAPSG